MNDFRNKQPRQRANSIDGFSQTRRPVGGFASGPASRKPANTHHHQIGNFQKQEGLTPKSRDRSVQTHRAQSQRPTQQQAAGFDTPIQVGNK